MIVMLRILKTEIYPETQLKTRKIEKDDSIALRVYTLVYNSDTGFYEHIEPDSISFFVTDTSNVDAYDFDATSESFYTRQDTGDFLVSVKMFEIGQYFFRVDWYVDGIKKSRKFLMDCVRDIAVWERGV